MSLSMCPGSVSLWIGGLKTGDAEAARKLWERYFDRLVHLTRDKLRAVRSVGGDQDEEDVALSTINSVCLGAVNGKFPRLGDRDDLWALLVVISARKALNQARDQRRQKRGGGRVRSEADLAAADAEEQSALAEIVGQEPSPEFAAIVAESYERRFAELGDATLRQIALMRLEGYGNDEIAAKRGCTGRTVLRKIEVIRHRWLGAEAASL
jgi:DNA-directed RNA polymerase specialized sigma24 family protein